MFDAIAKADECVRFRTKKIVGFPVLPAIFVTALSRENRSRDGAADLQGASIRAPYLG